MKKNLFMVAAVALMAMVSCNKMENNGGEEVVVPTIPFEFTAYASEDAATSAETQQPAMAQKVDTKAALVTVEGKPKTHWEATDKINVNGFEFTIDTKSEFGAGARFVGNVVENFGTEYKAVYPSTAGTWEAVTVKSSQKAKAGTFDPEALVAVAYSNTDNVLAFKHVTSLLKFQVPAACQTVTISSDNDLAGTIKITKVENDDPSTPGNESNVTIDVTTSQKTLTVTCEGGFKVGTDYYVAVLPGDKNNFVVRIDGYLSKNQNKVTINRSTIANMKTLPAPKDSKWRLRGEFDWSNGLTFYEDIDYFVVKNVIFTKTNKFKVFNTTNNEWLRSAANVALANKWYKIGVYDGGDSYVISGTYDIYVDSKGFNVYFCEAGKELTAAIPTQRTVTVYLNSTSYTHLWCWNKDKNSENFTGGSWPGQYSTTNETINGKTYRKWVLNSCNLGVYTNMIFSNNSSSQTGEDGNTGLLMGETMFVKLEGGKTRFNNDI